MQEVAAYINFKDANVVVDIGCGLGEMLRHIEAKTKIGYDIHKEVIEAAETLSKGNIMYNIGSFNEVNVEQPIDYLSTLNFIHGGTEET